MNGNPRRLGLEEANRPENERRANMFARDGAVLASDALDGLCPIAARSLPGVRYARNRDRTHLQRAARGADRPLQAPPKIGEAASVSFTWPIRSNRSKGGRSQSHQAGHGTPARSSPRFEAERQALALMDIPNIAKVFDGGARDAGRPYFVMELVKGC